MSKQQVVNEIHKDVRINFPRRSVQQRGIDDLWQADLIDMQFAFKINKKFKFIIIVIDVFSKYAWASPLKTKTKEEVSKVFESILTHSRRIPKNLQTDLGTEFYNSCFKKICLKYRINHYSTFSTKKASIAERFIRTLKSKLFKTFSYNGNYQWIGHTLDHIMHDYNHKKHSTIGIAPVNVNKAIEPSLLLAYRKKTTCESKKNKFNVGDYVRISKYKGIFEKGYTPNWSTEIFHITKINNTCPETYLIEDSRKQPIAGGFYAYELQKTMHSDVYLVEKVLKKKGNKVFVKWLGLPSSENTWIDKKNIL